MKQSEYINNENVKKFLEWLLTYIDEMSVEYKTFKPKGTWRCSSLYDAFNNYSWNYTCKDLLNLTEEGIVLSGSTYTESQVLLSRLRDILRTSVYQNDDKTALYASKMILDWGGVLVRGKKGHTNQDVLNSMSDGLCDYYRNTRNYFDSLWDNKIEVNDSLDNSSHQKPKVILNSGFTKIYSLLVDDFIMYDGRVGGALGMIVRQFCENVNLPLAIGYLDFAWGTSHGAKSCIKGDKRRDPGWKSNKYSFPRLQSRSGTNRLEKNSALHMHHNIRANWLLKELISKLPKDSKFKSIRSDTEILRAIEASLFMVGSCVGCQCVE